VSKFSFNYILCLSVFHCYDKIPDIDNFEEKDLFWLTVLEVLTHDGGEGMQIK
jgi:hypothetical protein